MKHLLSKSKYIRGLQCERALYYDVYQPRLARYSAETLARFNAGRDFEHTYKALFANGIDCSARYGLRVDSAPQLTAQLLQQDGEVTLFEAGFQHNGVLVLADVLLKSAQGQLVVHEVKNGQTLSETFCHDAAVQHYVIVNAIAHSGLSLSQFYVVHNNGQGGFSCVDLTARCQAEMPQVEANVCRFKTVLQGLEPSVPMGPQCHLPYECPYQKHCEWLNG